MALTISEQLAPSLQAESSDDAGEFIRLMELCRHHPCPACADLIPEQALERWRLAEAQQWAGWGRLVRVRHGGRLLGAAGWHPLPWDSRHFGFPAAKVEMLMADDDYASKRLTALELLTEVTTRCAPDGIRHLTARTGAEDLAAIHALQTAGFELMDGIQTFSRRLNGPPLPRDSSPSVRVGLFEQWQLDGILRIASAAYRFDRFHSDSALDAGVADRLHADWLANSCSGQAADAVMVASHAEEVLGFVTVRIERDIERWCGVRLATIVLVATASHARGRGIGRLLTLETLQWLADEKVDAVQVGTQLANTPAGRLYENCGFRLNWVSLTFRKLL